MDLLCCYLCLVLSLSEGMSSTYKVHFVIMMLVSLFWLQISRWFRSNVQSQWTTGPHLVQVNLALFHHVFLRIVGLAFLTAIVLLDLRTPTQCSVSLIQCWNAPQNLHIIRLTLAHVFNSPTTDWVAAVDNPSFGKCCLCLEERECDKFIRFTCLC